MILSRFKLYHTSISNRLRMRQAAHCDDPHPILPQHNWAARESTLCVLLGLVPGLGVFFGLGAILLGQAGLRLADEQPHLGGENQCRFNLYLGSFEVATNALGLYLIFFAR